LDLRTRSRASPPLLPSRLLKQQVPNQLQLLHLVRIMRDLLEPVSLLELATTRPVLPNQVTVLVPQIFSAAQCQKAVLARLMLASPAHVWLLKHALVKMVNQNLDIARVPPISNAVHQRMRLLQPHLVRTMLVSLELASLQENVMTKLVFRSLATALGQQIYSVAHHQRVQLVTIMLVLLGLVWLLKHVVVKMVNQNLDIAQVPPISNAVHQRKLLLQKQLLSRLAQTMESARITRAFLGRASLLENVMTRLVTRSPAIVLDQPIFNAVQYHRVVLARTMLEKKGPVWPSRHAAVRVVNQSPAIALEQQISNVVHSRGVQKLRGIGLEILLHTHVIISI
jgi:hypothetical protein